MPRNDDASPARKRLALVQLQRRQAIADAQRAALREVNDDNEITARVEALSMAAATAALAGAARASLHDSDPPTVGSQKKLFKAIIGALAGLAGLGALAKIIVDALK